ncbi:MAG: energy transducer TonB [Sulfuritalea sp.]|nr:energy transducer TonB [Sulfuritalea sp.]
MNSPRLAWPLAISLALHLGLGWLLSAEVAGHLTRSAKAVTLTVVLASRETTESPAAVAAQAAPAPPPAAATAVAATDAAGSLTRKARFLVEPDLADLEEIAVPFSGSLTLRLHVSALGTVDRVIVVNSDPVPKQLLDGLMSRFAQARLTPAQAGSQAVASTLDVMIRYEAAPALPIRGR